MKTLVRITVVILLLTGSLFAVSQKGESSHHAQLDTKVADFNVRAHANIIGYWHLFTLMGEPVKNMRVVYKVSKLEYKLPNSGSWRILPTNLVEMYDVYPILWFREMSDHSHGECAKYSIKFDGGILGNAYPDSLSIFDREYSGNSKYLSFNVPDSPSWEKFINRASAKVAKEIMKEGIWACGVEYTYPKSKWNTSKLAIYFAKLQRDKQKQKAKRRLGITKSQSEIDSKRAYLKDKQSKLSGSKYTDKERYLLAAIEQAKKQNDPANEALFRKRLKGLHKAGAYFKTEFKKLNKAEKKIVAYNKKVRVILKTTEIKIPPRQSQQRLPSHAKFHQRLLTLF